MTQDNIFKEVKLKTAQEVLDYLRLSAPHWEAKDHTWIFRGQANSDWKLLPSAWRVINNDKKVVSQSVKADMKELIPERSNFFTEFTEPMWVNLEYLLEHNQNDFRYIINFIQLCNSLG